jgi:hypothetical protein
MGLQERSMDTSIFFGRIGIQVAADLFQAIKYLVRRTSLRTLKQEMFDKMSGPVLPFFFSSGSRMYNHTTMRDRRVLSM